MTNDENRAWTRLAAFVRSLGPDPQADEIGEALAGALRDSLGLDAVCVRALDNRWVVTSPSDLVDLAIVDGVQHVVEQGPSVEAAVTDQARAVDDLEDHRTRWPAYVEAALDAGIHAVLSLPLSTATHQMGTVACYRLDAHPWSEDEVVIAEAFAAVASARYAGTSLVRRQAAVVDQLQRALDSRVQIEQAKGVLAASEGISVDEAFERIRAYARHRREPMAAVARAVVHEDLRPTRPGSRRGSEV